MSIIPYYAQRSKNQKLKLILKFDLRLKRNADNMAGRDKTTAPIGHIDSILSFGTLFDCTIIVVMEL